MIVLDTNVLSARMRQSPDAKVITWLDKQSRTSVWTTSVTILEIRFGLQIMAAGKRSWFVNKNSQWWRIVVHLILDISSISLLPLSFRPIPTGRELPSTDSKK